MPIDFGKLGTGKTSDSVFSPREIFSLLPTKDAKYRYLRDVQAEVLDAWFGRRTGRDIVLRMNTGSGKTVVGLLLLKSCLNEGAGPAVYITPDNYLGEQVRLEASALGIETVNEPRSAEFQRGNAIFVGNIHKLINGKSVFGVGTEGARISIGTLLIDDVHACLDSTESQFTLVVNADVEQYKDLCKVFRHYLHQQSSVRACEVEAQEPGKFMLVPFWAWAERQSLVVPILHGMRDLDSIKFTWPLIKESLSLCYCVIGEGRIEISPPCIPISVIPSVVSARRRIFMSATLSDDSVLVSHFAVSPEAVSQAITPTLASDIGDRMIVVPQELNASIKDSDLKALLKKMSKACNVVVIVPSFFRSQFWGDSADLILSAENLRKGVEQLKAGHVGLVVLVNKYDGVDLPYDACRVLVIDGLPDVRRAIDRVEQGILSDANLMLTRLVQRIEQGMGRGIRSNDDHCVVFLMGRTLVGCLYARGALRVFTPATQAQIALSDKLAKQLRGEDLGAIEEAVGYCLKRDKDWVKAGKSVLAGIRYRAEGSISPVVIAQRRAFDSASVGGYPKAVAVMQDAANAEKDPLVRGWLKQQLASYVHHVDPIEAQRILRSGIAENRYIIRPMDGIQYTRLSSAGHNQASRCAEFLQAGCTDPNECILAINSLVDRLVFQPDTSEAFEQALKDVASYLGYEGQRPESEAGRGPDVLWLLGEMKYLVVECKNGAVVKVVSKDYCNQLAGSVNWFTEEYGPPNSCKPLLIHPSCLCERAAAPHPEMRIMTDSLLPQFADAIRRFVTSAVESDGYKNPVRVHELLIQYGLTGDRVLRTFTVGPKSQV